MLATFGINEGIAAVAGFPTLFKLFVQLDSRRPWVQVHVAFERAQIFELTHEILGDFRVELVADQRPPPRP